MNDQPSFVMNGVTYASDECSVNLSILSDGSTIIKIYETKFTVDIYFNGVKYSFILENQDDSVCLTCDVSWWQSREETSDIEIKITDTESDKLYTYETYSNAIGQYSIVYLYVNGKKYKLEGAEGNMIIDLGGYDAGGTVNIEIEEISI